MEKSALTDEGSETTSEGLAGRKPTAAYAFYVVVLLMLINVVASLDRRVINIVAEPIRNELHLQDWHIGMMTGLAFAIFYAALGVPIARLADRSSRPLVIVSALTIWSGFTALCATAQNFTQLFLFRMGVGVGEAGCSPPAQSIITDYTPRAKRASALAFWAAGVPLGALCGFALGGIIADHYGWRAAFLVAGLPGLLLAAIAAFTLKETRSRLRADVAKAKADQPTMRELMKVLSKKRTYWVLMFNTALGMVNSYGLQAFVVSFLLRNHTQGVATLADGFGLGSVGFLGLAIGLIAGACAAVSIFVGGWVADKAGAKDVSNTMYAPAIGCALGMPIVICSLLTDNTVLALCGFACFYLLSGFGNGPVYSAMQSIVAPNMRATAAALALFLEIIIGQAAGPVIVGLISDYFANEMGAAEGLRYSLICVSCLAIPCTIGYLAARKTMREDFES